MPSINYIKYIGINTETQMINSKVHLEQYLAFLKVVLVFLSQLDVAFTKQGQFSNLERNFRETS